jgi:adenylate cyclase
MQHALRELQPEFRERNWPEIHIGVGINTDLMSVGNMGFRIRLAYTVNGRGGECGLAARRHHKGIWG